MICLTTRYPHQALALANHLRRELPHYKTEVHDQRNVHTEATSGQAREAANACDIPQDSRWIVQGDD